MNILYITSIKLNDQLMTTIFYFIKFTSPTVTPAGATATNTAYTLSGTTTNSYGLSFAVSAVVGATNKPTCSWTAS